MVAESSHNNVLHILASKNTSSAVDAARALLRNGENPQPMHGGRTPLHVAAEVDNLEMVQLLMHFGADPTAVDRHGDTVLDVANGKTEEFLLRLLSVGEKQRRGILRRFFFCHSGWAVNGFLKKTRKRLRRITSGPILRRPPSISDPTPFPTCRHDPLPFSVVVEDDPLPSEREVLPGTPIRSKTPPLPDTSKVTTKRGGRQRATRTKTVAASDTVKFTPRKGRSKSLDVHIFGKEGKTTPAGTMKASTPKAVRQKTPQSARNARLLTATTPKNGRVRSQSNTPRAPRTPSSTIPPTTPARSAVERQCARKKVLPPPRPQPSAPPLEKTPVANRKNVSTASEMYFTADESLLDEIETRLKKINLHGNQEEKRVAALTDNQLRAELRRVGMSAGPINKGTRKGYERKLILAGNHKVEGKKYNTQLESAIKGTWKRNGEELDKLLLRELDEGARCFVYLLIDPRKLRKNEPVTFSSLIPSIFYVGKATGERPLCHLVDAKRFRCGNSPATINNQKDISKLERINSIWDSGNGVVTIELGKNIGDKLALTREGCIMEAIGGKNLTNIKGGEFHGVARSWDGRTRADYGIYLLQKAVALYNADSPVPVMPKNVPDQLFGGKKK